MSNKVVIKTPGSKQVFAASLDELNLDTLQAIVGGYIELVKLHMGGRVLDLYCNEEGTILNLQPNVSLGDSDLPPICGTVVVLSHDGEGNSIGLDNEEVKMAMERLSEAAVST